MSSQTKWEKIILQYCRDESNWILSTPGIYKCWRPFNIYYSGGELSIDVGSQVYFDDDFVNVKERPSDDDEDEPEGLGWKLLHAMGKALTSPEHHIEWDSITRISSS